MALFFGSNFGFEFGAKTCLFWSLSQIISAWLVLEAAGCEQSGLSLLYCGSTSMIPAAKLWNKSLATGCSMMVYPWVDTCRLPGFKTMQRNCTNGTQLSQKLNFSARSLQMKWEILQQRGLSKERMPLATCLLMRRSRMAVEPKPQNVKEQLDSLHQNQIDQHDSQGVIVPAKTCTIVEVPDVSSASHWGHSRLEWAIIWITTFQPHTEHICRLCCSRAL